jgi:hypothetical protein
VQHIKIYLPCNFEVNLSTQFGVLALFLKVLTFLKFDEKRAITSRWVIRFTLKL